MSTKTTTSTRVKSEHNGNGAHGPWPKTAPVQPWIRVPNVRDACEFYEQLGFHVVLSIPSADGKWAWASLNCGGSGFQIFGTNNTGGPNVTRDARPTMQNRGLGVTFCVNVPDVKRVHQVAKAAKLTITSDLRDEFTGERIFTCIDPYGYEWAFAQTTKILTPNEVVEGALRRDH